MKHKTLAYLFCFATAALLLAACQPHSAASMVLGDTACQPPCWNGIQPGVTTLDEAAAILGNTASVKPGTVERSTLPWNGFDRVFWEFPDTARGTIYAENQIVTAVTFNPIGKSSMFDRGGKLGITIAEALETYGDPEFILLLRGYDGFHFFWFYPDQGVSFSYGTFRKVFVNHKEISPKNIITGIDYFAPAALDTLYEKAWFGYTGWSAETVSDFTYPWNGYGNLDETYPPKKAGR